MPHSLQVWGIPPGETNRKVIAVFYDEAKLADQKKTELEKEGYKKASSRISTRWTRPKRPELLLFAI
jgi:hypothetical protein